MKRRLIIDGNAVYEIDEECMLKKRVGEKKEHGDKREYEGKKTSVKNSIQGQVDS